MLESAELSTGTNHGAPTLEHLGLVIAAWADQQLGDLHFGAKPPYAGTPESRAFSAAGAALEPTEPAIAEFFYRRALEIDPRNAGAALNLALLYASAGDFNDAARLLWRYTHVIESLA